MQWAVLNNHEEGGNSKYGNENFLKYLMEWAESTEDYPSCVFTLVYNISCY
jgi:hypothetical protein